MLKMVTKWATVIRDVGLILGIPTIIVVGLKLYGVEVDALKQQNELLTETQYDLALSLLVSQKDLFEIERQELEQEFKSLQASGESASQEAKILKHQLEKIKQGIANFTKSIYELQVNSTKGRFRSNVVFRQTEFDGRVDFSQTYLTGNVNFAKSLFKGNVDFSGSIFQGRAGFLGAQFRTPPDFSDAQMKDAIFNGTDLRGADLSRAIVDKNTHLPAHQ